MDSCLVRRSVAAAIATKRLDDAVRDELLPNGRSSDGQSTCGDCSDVGPFIVAALVQSFLSAPQSLEHQLPKLAHRYRLGQLRLASLQLISHFLS